MYVLLAEGPVRPDSQACMKITLCVQVKKGPLAETSPMLNDISGVATWSKVGCLAFVYDCHPGSCDSLMLTVAFLKTDTPIANPFSCQHRP